MKPWRCLLGVRWLIDEPRIKVGEFVTENHMLAREKWSALGKGRSRVVKDEQGKTWGMACKFHLREDEKFVIDIEIKLW
jgi:hypothetical protein